MDGKAACKSGEAYTPGADELKYPRSALPLILKAAMEKNYLPLSEPPTPHIPFGYMLSQRVPGSAEFHQLLLPVRHNTGCH